MQALKWNKTRYIVTLSPTLIPTLIPFLYNVEFRLLDVILDVSSSFEKNKYA